MRIISFIEDREVIKAILKHLGLWLVKSRPIPKAHAPPALNQNGSGPAVGDNRKGAKSNRDGSPSTGLRME